jgi:hypothetical protein
MKSTILAVVSLFCVATAAQVHGDDAVVNTPVILASLKGDWELQQNAEADFIPRLRLDGSHSGQWFQSKETLPVTITFYVEGGELLLQHYYEPKGSFNYRLKQLRFIYMLDGTTLTLTKDRKSETWKRRTNPNNAKP